MKKFTLFGKVTISVCTEVVAENIDEAIKIVEDRDIEFADSSINQVLECWVCSEFDGEVFDIEIDE